ncbi:DNA polymerase Y family protein [Granulicoccus sp. GXG6511]|uniref:DNA polymerase Y family protein n=1 Tax=Granulicoccus sp. GXG6511 TaxID=3381351 RepID=UPI003D7CCCE7
MRAMALWCPDWPVHAIRQTAVGEALPPGSPLAVVSAGAVYACSPEARSFGVRRGLRLRDAQARCPELVTLDHDPGLDRRAFEPVLAIVEETVPQVQSVRPGLCVFRVRGAARYLGGEPEVAAVIAEQLAHFGVPETRFGVADGLFAAQQAARRADPGECTVITEGGDAAFLAGLPVTVLEQPALTDLLRRLGLRTLGDFASLSERDVVNRFGPEGAAAHRLARGGDRRTVTARIPPRDFERTQSFEPALTRIDEVAFSLRATAEAFVADLADAQLVCSSLWVAIHDESGHVGERLWRHPRWFRAADVIDRVRWQLAAEGTRAGVSTVRFVPEDLAAAGNFTETLWGGGSDDRIQRAVSKLQGSLGREAVVSVVLHGGRTPADRQATVAWGDPVTGGRPVARPWPGQLPAPAPATVYAPPLPATVLGPTGRSVTITDRGRLSGTPTRFRAGTMRESQPVHAWAGPWPADERWWDGDRAHRAARCQLVAADGSAWLVAVSGDEWCTEARYD